MINNSLNAAGTVVAALSPEQLSDLVAKMKDQGVLYHGMQVLGGGSILGGLILGAIAVSVIDRKFIKAAGFAFAGAVMTFFGFMHGERIGVGETPTVAFSYVVIAVIFAACSRFAVAQQPAAEEIEAPHGEEVPA
jgi:AGZA family xanthine/uracil permease-like MFS transporter